MKKLIITLLILAVTLSFTSMSFARWNDSGFKSSPLFKHALNNAIDRLEGKINAVSEGDKPTSKAGCSDPKAENTLRPICNTVEVTCEGSYTCVTYPTCMGGPTCGGSTCYSTCYGQYTCEGYSTCASTCGCPPMLSGYVKNQGEIYNWSGWSNRIVTSAYLYLPYSIDQTTFGIYGYYSSLESDYGWIALAADADNYTISEHAHGEAATYQQYQNQSVNIDMDEFTDL